MPLYRTFAKRIFVTKPFANRVSLLLGGLLTIGLLAVRYETITQILSLKREANPPLDPSVACSRLD